MSQLKALLPPLGDAALSPEDGARSVLHLLNDTTEIAITVKSDPHNCPNCDTPVEKTSSPYCSEACRSQSAFVRQLRAALANEQIQEPEKQIVFGERLWWLLGGGLPMREARIPESAKRQVRKRCQGLCETCGQPMTKIENVGSGCNRPLHLRAVCDQCSKTKPFGDPEFIHSAEVQSLLNTLNQRISATTPIKPCDDSDTWDWREFILRRRQ